MKTPLISQDEVLTKIREYAQKYPINSRDRRISDTGHIIREIMFDIFQNIPIRAYENDNCSNK